MVKTKWRVGQRSPQSTWLQVDYLCTNGFNLEVLSRGFVIQRQILIIVIIFIAYVLNLPRNMQKPHYHSQRARKWSLILAHDGRLLYHAPTYITVPLLGPHQPRYIEPSPLLNQWWNMLSLSTVYNKFKRDFGRSISVKSIWCILGALWVDTFC